jgi:hypothetical protein
MKKALKLALIYLIVLILGTLAGTVLYSFYLNLLGFIAGRDITFFKDEELFKSLFYVLFCMQIFILPLISYYRIRRPGGTLQLIVYIILCLLTWALLMPATIKLRDYCNRKFSFEKRTESLSPNYFRKVDSDVYYFTREFNVAAQGRAAEAPAVIIDTTESGGVEYKAVADYPSLVLNRKAAPFREVQLKNIFGEDENPVPIDFKMLFSMITGAYSGGLAHLLTLFSFVLLLCSVYGMTSLFDWRLLNAVMLFITTALILCLNSLYFSAQFLNLKARLMNNGFLRAFGGIVSEPILFIINCFFALLIIAAGIIKFAVRHHAKKAR